MSAGAIKKVTVKKHEYILENLNEFIPRQIWKKYFKLSGIACNGIERANINRIIKHDGSFFAYCKDRRVYYSIDGMDYMDTNTGIHSMVPNVLSAYLSNMHKVFLITSSLYSKLFDEYEIREDSYMGATHAVYYKGRFYMASMCYIYVFKKFDYVNACNSLEVEDNMSTLPQDSTWVVKLFVLKDKLYYMNETGIYLVRYDKKVKELKKLDLFPFVPTKNSTIKIGEQALCFISENKICVFDGEKLNVRKTMIDDMKGVTFTAFGASGSYYFINLTLDGINYTYAYNVLTGEEILSDYYKLLSDYDGIAINTTNNALVKLSIAQKKVTDASQELILTEDLGYCGNKIITGFEIHVKGSGEIIFSGDFGEKGFLLKNGCNTVRCNIGSKNYAIKFQNLSSDFTVEKAKLKYRQCGD